MNNQKVYTPGMTSDCKGGATRLKIGFEVGQEGEKPIWPPTVSAEAFKNKRDMWGTADALIHICIWIMALIFDHLLLGKAGEWSKTTTAADGSVVAAIDTVTETYALAALITAWIAFAVIAGTILRHWMAGDQGFTGQANAVILGMITSGVRSSLIFTMICALFTVGVNPATDRGVDWRNWTIFALVLKIYLNNILSHNISKTLA